MNTQNEILFKYMRFFIFESEFAAQDILLKVQDLLLNLIQENLIHKIKKIQDLNEINFEKEIKNINIEEKKNDFSISTSNNTKIVLFLKNKKQKQDAKKYLAAQMQGITLRKFVEISKINKEEWINKKNYLLFSETNKFIDQYEYPEMEYYFYEKYHEIKYSKYLSDIDSSHYSSLPDVSPLIVDFLESSKKIFSLGLQTGAGKSMAVNKIASYLFYNEEFGEKFERLIYLTPRKNNIDQEYNNFIHEYPSLKSHCLKIVSNTDCIINNDLSLLKDDLESLKKSIPANELKNIEESIDKVEKYKSEYFRNKNNKYFKEEFEVQEATLRKKLSHLLLSKEKNTNTYNELLEKIAKVYPQAYLQIKNPNNNNFKKIIFVNASKLLNVIDTFEETKFYLYEKDYIINKSIIIFDEADQIKTVILNTNTQQYYVCNLIQFNKIINNSQKVFNGGCIFPENYFSSEIVKNNIKECLTNLYNKTEKISKKYNLYKGFCIKEPQGGKRWLFKSNDNTIQLEGVGTQDLISKFSYDPTSNITNIIKEDSYNLLDYFSDSSFEYSEVANDLIETSRDFILILKKIFKHRIEQLSKNNEDKINKENVLKEICCFFCIEDEKYWDLIKNSILYRTTSKESKISLAKDIPTMDDFYNNPGSYTVIENLDESDYQISLMTYFLESTPEAFLEELLKFDTHIILSSATVEIPSVYSNFNLSRNVFQSELFLFDFEQTKKYNNYLSSLSKYCKDVYFTVNPSTEFLSSKSKNNYDFKSGNLTPEQEIKIREHIGWFNPISPDYNFELYNQFLSAFFYNLGNKENSISHRNYYFNEYLNILKCLYNEWKQGTKSIIVFTKYNIKPKNVNNTHKNFFKILEEISEIIDGKFYFSDSDSLGKDNIEFKISVYENKFSVIFTSYDNASTGFNFKCRRKLPLEQIVAVNDRGKNILANTVPEIDNTLDVEIDVECIYLGNITYNNFQVNPETDTPSKKLEAIYYIYSKVIATTQNYEEVAQLLREILSKSSAKIKEDINSIGKFLSVLIQANGRGSRTPLRLRNCSRYLGENIEPNMRDLPCLMPFIGVDFFDNLSWETKEILNKVKDGFNSIVKQPILEICRYGNEQINIALDQINEHSVTIYDYEDYNKIKSFIIDESNYNSLPDRVKALYFEFDKDKKDYFEDGYSTPPCYLDSYGNFVACNAYQYNEGKIRFSNNELNINLLKNNTEVLSKLTDEYHFNFNNQGSKYFLTPQGFQILAGNLGEALFEIVNKISPTPLKIQNLPPEIYEVVDFIDVDDNEDYILGFDVKYQNVKEYKDDIEINYINKYSKKLQKIYNYYNKKTIIVVINMKPFETNNISYKNSIHIEEKNKNGFFITIPNIWDNNFIAQDISQIVFQKIKNI